MRVSSGCIRLRDDDIKTLFNVVTPGTKVNIINTPIKVSEEPGGVRLVEIHQPLSKNIDDDPQTLPINLNAAMVSFKTNANTESRDGTCDGGPVRHADRCHPASRYRSAVDVKQNVKRPA